jgi:DNA phosphorothioation-dependent restriction protein DptG
MKMKKMIVEKSQRGVWFDGKKRETHHTRGSFE